MKAHGLKLLILVTLLNLWSASEVAAYYDPEVGRYLTRDPAGYADGLNPYLYVHNNPVNHIDPLGLQAAEEDDENNAAAEPAFIRGPENLHAAQHQANGMAENLAKVLKRLPLDANSADQLYLSRIAGQELNAYRNPHWESGGTSEEELNQRAEWYGSKANRFDQLIKQINCANSAEGKSFAEWQNSAEGQRALGGMRELINSTGMLDRLNGATKGTPTTLYRTVGPEELADIGAAGGRYRVPLGGTQGKYFFETPEQASNFARMMGDKPYTTTSVPVSPSQLGRGQPINPAREGPGYFFNTPDVPSGTVNIFTHSVLP